MGMQGTVVKNPEACKAYQLLQFTNLIKQFSQLVITRAQFLDILKMSNV